MFINFPEEDFQFLLKEEDKEATIKWLEENGVRPNLGSISSTVNWCPIPEEGRYFTVKNKILFMAFSSSYPSDSLPTYTIYNKDKELFLVILESVLKELGYYRKGRKDPVIQLMIDNLRNYNGNFQPHEVINLTSFRNSLCLFMITNNTNIVENYRLDEESYKALMFYRTIYLLTVNTYLNLLGKSNSHITEDSYVVQGVVENFMVLNFDPVNFSTFSRIRLVPPKEVIKYIKKELKPTILSDDTLPDSVYKGLTYV